MTWCRLEGWNRSPCRGMLYYMELIPAIDIRGGRGVRLYQGDYDRETIFADDPAEVAARFQDAGATRLHVVDLDGAREGWPVNGDAITRILQTVTVLIEVGGGLRNVSDVEATLSAGADAVVLGTAAVKDRDFLAQALGKFPGQIIVGIDARDGLVAVEGWRQTSQMYFVELAQEIAKMGIERFIYTDILSDGTLDEPNFTAIAELIDFLPTAEIIASGGVSRFDHIMRLRDLGASGAIVGRAVYTGDIDLKQALSELAKLPS